ncbi:MAG TPA: hypothetical protein EYP35_06080 [Desulfobacterales bacterium]|nr:hypothetical protein [Desulfobacterales bacterium]
MRENWKRAISDKSSFTHSMSEETRTQFSATVGAGGIPILNKIGPNAQLLVIGQNGEQVSFNVSEDTARAFENTASKVRSESLQQTLQDSKSLDYMTKLAKQIGATEAYSFLNDARELRTSTESYGADLTTALVRNYATERYGSESPENIRRTISDFNHYLTVQGSQGVNNMHDIINGFVSGKGYGWGNTTAAVHEAMNAANDRVQGPNGFKHSVGMAAMDAGAKTFSVKEGNLSPPSPDVPMNTPNPKTVINPADDIRLRNRTEESGNGRIHTTAGKIVKDMAGKNKTDPPRPTHDFYRNQSFYHEGSLVEPQRQEKGIVLPSGMVIRGDADYTPPENDKDFFKGSVFEKK